jgi:hypothetical protein
MELQCTMPDRTRGNEAGRFRSVLLLLPTSSIFFRRLLLRRIMAVTPSTAELTVPEWSMLMAHQLAERQLFFASLAAQAHEQGKMEQAHKEATRVDGWGQQQDGTNASDTSSSQPPPPPPQRRHRFLVSKKLLPTLLGNQRLPSAVPQPAELSSGATAALYAAFARRCRCGTAE